VLAAAFACGLTACGSSSAPPITSKPPTGAPAAHYAAAYYPLYNFGVNQWIEPKASMPFDKIGHLFAAFAHAYPKGKGAILTFERSQPQEPARLRRLEKIARAKNPKIKILVTLGWHHQDWDYIATDQANRAGLFVPSVVSFLRTNALDGFDIDDEGIGRQDTGTIHQDAFDAVVAQLREALDRAAKTDKHAYVLVITPAGDNVEPGGIEDTQVDEKNAGNFDWINIQNYYAYPSWGSSFLAGLEKIGYPMASVVVGVNTEGCKPKFPSYDGLKGIFDWTMSADSACKFKYTRAIAKAVDYKP
jgi:hypothetical protein